MVEHARALRRKRDDAGMESQAGKQSRDGSKSRDGPAAMRLELAEESCSVFGLEIQRGLCEHAPSPSPEFSCTAVVYYSVPDCSTVLCRCLVDSDLVAL